MNFQFDKIKSDCLVSVGAQQSVVESVISDSIAHGIERILSLSAESKPVSVDAGNGEAVVSGRINFKLVYLSENEPKSVDIFADFSERITSELITPHSKLFADMTIIDSEAVRDGVFKMRAVAETSLTALSEKESGCLFGADAAVHTKKTRIPLTKHIASGTANAEITDEQSVGANVGKILHLDARSIVSSAKAGDGVILVTGDVAFTVLYYASEAVNSLNFRVPFGEEIRAEGVSLTDIVSAKASIAGARIIITGDEDDNIIKVAADLRLRADAFMSYEEEVVLDGFSLKKELDFERGELKLESFGGMNYYSDRVSGIAALGDGRAAARDIAGIVGARNNLASVVPGDEGVTFEGLVTAAVIYTDENGLNSVQLEVPYSLNFAAKNMSPSSLLKAEAIVLSAEARVKRDREIEVSADIALKTDSYDEKTFECVMSASEGADKPQNNSAISVYITSQGESIWDAVKALSALPDDIIAQNPNLSIPFKGGEKIIYFRSLASEVG
ncbi:MAG: DUF3794 domain-containing protein [Clostridiaceae bacterium]|jgi:hypothetical protein|nr:DUF3794 domain-containing protein [Clostridiaceae bacterium]